MRDLELWRRLQTGDVTPAELAVLTIFPLSRRAAYVRGLVALTTHADPALRVAAYGALAGLRGVSGVRVLVQGLDDDEPAVREAAVLALRATANEAPHRFVHALFHERIDVRRIALRSLPTAAIPFALHLRADPDCADLANELAFPATKDAFILALDLYTRGCVRDLELATLIATLPRSDLKAVVTGARAGETDCMLRAIGGAHAFGEPLAALMGVTNNNEIERLSMLAALARMDMHAMPAELFGAMCALEPGTLEDPRFDATLAPAAAAGLNRWRGRLPRQHPNRIVTLLRLPLVRADLALAVAVADLAGVMRLRLLKKQLGTDAIVHSLLQSNHGWDDLLALPPENPRLELEWLQRIMDANHTRYLELVARAILIWTGTRLEELVAKVPLHSRGELVPALAARADLAPDDPKLGAALRVLAGKLDVHGLARALTVLLAAAPPGPVLSLQFARGMDLRDLAAAAAELDDDTALRLIALLDGDDPLPRNRELAVAHAFKKRSHPALATWAAQVSRIETEIPLVEPASERTWRALTDKESAEIASAPDIGTLNVALVPALKVPVTGLAAALAQRSAAPSVRACAALLGCADPIHEVARQLDRFARVDQHFLDDLDNACSQHWNRAPDLPPLAHARLWRWERHGFALALWIERAGGVLGALRLADDLPGRLAARTLWCGVSEVTMLMRYRDRPRFERDTTIEVARYCAARVDRDIGRYAARIVLAAVEGRSVPLAEVRGEVIDRAADATAEAREYLARIVRLEGMPEPPRAVLEPPAKGVLQQIRETTDIGRLVAWCHDLSPAVVQEAALALVMLGADGQVRLAELVRDLAALQAPIAVVSTVILWDAPAAIAIVREVANTDALPPAWQYHLSLGLHVLGDPGQLERALAAARAPGTTWFRRVDWDPLVAAVDPRRVALALADAPHHHAYRRSVELLLERPADDADAAAALKRFLEIDADRPLELRRTVARHLAYEHGDLDVAPLLLEEIIDDKVELATTATPRSLAAVIAHGVADAALIGGHSCCSERRMGHVHERLRTTRTLDLSVYAQIAARILDEASTNQARQDAIHFVLTGDEIADRLEAVAQVFAWGVRRGLELTSRILRIHLTAKETDLGHTYLSGNKIYVTALPMLRGEEHGRDIVEGLILHEIGHHAYHASEADRALWDHAHKQGLGHLLNLIADEHLERNLRAVNGEYGDRLKRLDAYAFQHAPQELRVEPLLAGMRGHAATALIAAPLGVAFDETAVRVRRGAILGELDKHGHPLARFARALRMGLGNRHGDPLVEQALALVGKDLRKLDMKAMYALTRKLADLFGGAVALAKVFGGPEGLGFGERDEQVFGGGIDDEVLQREVERILDPKRGKSGPRSGRIDRLQINVNPDTEFDRITHVRRIRGDAAAHAQLGIEVARHSTRLRALLDDLGLRWEPVRARIQGRTVDRTRLRALVTRMDPRILQARTPVRRTDLFLGTLIDCSGSMAAGNNLDRARRFAVLIAEAVRPLRGVDARFFGFTDSTIYDCGDAHDCGVTGLQSEGGNNDAAGLYHAASVAAGSPRRAKVLVMISDGLPTECSVASLRALATTLTKRKGIVCAQVAVRPLEEECFLHHVLLDDSQIDIAVARFGRLVGDLTRRALGTS